MKKKILCLFVSIIVLATLCACGQKVESGTKDNPSMFISVERTMVWQVVYHKETKVMYAVSFYGNGSGVFTLLVNADGTPMLWED